MKVLLLILTVIGLGTSAEAREGRGNNIHFSSTNTYYSCSAAEALTTAHLQTLGAEDIKVVCSGGLPDWWYLDVFASYTIASASDVSASYLPVTIETTSSCDLNEAILTELFANFYVKNLATKGTCTDSKGRLTFSAKVLR
jgi:hypothetical protein